MFKKLLALIAGTVVLILGIMFSMVVLAVFVVLGMAGFAFFWWKTRKLRGMMQQQQAPGGVVIDGEAIVVEDHPAATNNVLSGDTRRQ